MNPDLKRECRNGQDLARACYIFASVDMNEGNSGAAKYWQERARMHAARVRSMMQIEQEDYHG